MTVKKAARTFFWVAGFIFLAMPLCASLSWGQPLAMGKIELQGKAVVKAGKGLVFQAPKEAEAPLMQGASISTGSNGKALVDWTGKGSMAFDQNSAARVTEDGFELMKGKVTVRLNPGQVLKIKAMGKVYVIKAAAGKAAVATIAMNGSTVSTTGAVAMAGGSAIAGAAPGYVGPALLAGASVGGIAAVAASESNKGGGGVASPTTP